MAISGLVRGGWVVAAAQSGGVRIIEDGAVYHEGGTIREVGSFDDLSTRHPHIEVVGSREHVVLPGFVNAHHHAFVPSMYQRGCRDDTLETWLMDFYWQPTQDPYRTTLQSGLSLLESGVTTVLHLHYSKGSEGRYEEEIAQAIAGYREAGIRVSFGPEITDQRSWVYERDGEFARSLPAQLRQSLKSFSDPEEKRVSPDRYFALFDKLMERFQGQRVRLILRPVVPHYCSDKLLEEMKARSRALGVGIHINIYETMYQRMYAERLYGKSAVRHLDQLGFLDRRVSCAHGVWLDDEDLTTIADSGASVVSNPSSNLRLGSGIAPVIPMLRRGIPVALGIDACGINDDDDMFQEMRLSWMLNRLPGCASDTLSSEEIFLMAARTGARATFWDDRIGAIQTGKQADLVLLDGAALYHPLGSPRVSLLDDLVQLGRRSHVDIVLVDGESLVEGGRALRASREDLTRQLADEYQESIGASSAKLSERRQVCEDVKKYLKQYYGALGDLPGRPFYRYNRRG